MEILGIDFSFIPEIKLVFGVVILMLACCVASLQLLSSNPSVKFLKRALLLVLLVAIVYLNIHSYSSDPYVFLAAEIAILIVLYKLYINIIQKLSSNQDEDSVSRYIDEIKRKNSRG